jgi:hypothetical protein
MTFNHLSHYSIDFKPYNVTAMAMFLTSDGDHDGTFTRTELDHVFVVYDTIPNIIHICRWQNLDFPIACEERRVRS